MKDDKKVLILILVKSEGNIAQAAKSSDIRSKSANQAYRDNFETIFGAKEDKSLN